MPAPTQARTAGRALLSARLSGDPALADVLTRYDRWVDDLWDGLATVYDAEAVLPQVLAVIATIHGSRSEALRQRDRERILRPDWFTNGNEVNYALTKKGEPEKGTAISRKSIAAFVATIIQNPELHKNENLGISKPN